MDGRDDNSLKKSEEGKRKFLVDNEIMTLYKNASKCIELWHKSSFKYLHSTLGTKNNSSANFKIIKFRWKISLHKLFLNSEKF